MIPTKKIRNGMDVGMVKTILSYGALTAGFFFLLLSYHDAMNDTFINGLGIIFTLYLKIMTETAHVGSG